MKSEAGAQEPIPTLPGGTVTFLFTDIEGSTQRWEHHRDAMQAAVARHEQILKAAVERHSGFVFKTVGDAFCVAFPTAPDALAAALDAQVALAKEDFSEVDGLRVRMGLHTGYAEERNADYFGPAINRVARLTSIGHGGQVLLSAATRELAYSDLPPGTSLADLGPQRLRDVMQPVQVWQLNIAGLQSEFPPLRSLNAPPHNLPIQRTTFVGREHEVAEVKEQLAGHRLVTLIGSGGVGKTRLALQIGAELLDRYPDGVWFVDLAPISDPELVSSVTAKVLGINQQQGRPIIDSIPQWLLRKKLLIVFDNCEHVLDAVTSITASILTRAPDVRILGTSRQPLGIGGEVVYRPSSLSVPPEGIRLQTEEALQYDAVRLFVDRAFAADSRFALTDDNAPIIAGICRHLDGIPLAIELAAARVVVLSISNVAERLRERFKILTSGSRNALPRQKTLSAAIDWSYDLLTPQEQLLLSRLSIFAGGFGLHAITTVCGREGLGEVEMLDLLTSLVDKSLVLADTSEDQERYHLLESTRAYALEKLTALGERESLARRHAEYFRDQAQEADDRYGTDSTAAWLARVELELDNYRAALEWALTQGNNAVLGAAIAGGLDGLWFLGGLTMEGRYWVEPALERVNESEHPAEVARLLLAASKFSSGKHSYEKTQRATALYESVGDTSRAARARFYSAAYLNQMGRREEASEAIARALEILRKLGEKALVAECLNVQALIEGGRGNTGAGRNIYAQALAEYKELGDETGIALVLGNMAEIEFADGHFEEAQRLASERLAIDLRGKSATSIANAYTNSAGYRIALGDFVGARESSREGLRWARQVRDESYVAVGLQHLAVLSALGGNLGRGAQLLGYVDTQYKELGLERESTEKWGYEKLMSVLRERLSEADIAKLAAEGSAWSEDQAVEEALKV